MKLGWFRLHTEARNDAKLRTLNAEQFRVWFNLLCMAAEAEDDQRGSIEAMDSTLLAIECANGDTALLESTLVQLAKLRIIEWRDDGSLAFLNFLKRQYDKPSDRPEATRERKARSRASHTESRDVTPMSRDKTRVTDREEYIQSREDNRDTSKAVIRNKSSKVFVSMSSAERANNTTHTSKNSKGRQSTPATPPDTPTPMVDLSKLPQKVASKFLPEQIADEFEKWQEYANEKGYTNRSINHFADWLERIDSARIIPPHETELERLLRLSHGKADEKGLINGKTPSGWEYAISAAKFTAEEAERRAARHSRITTQRANRPGTQRPRSFVHSQQNPGYAVLIASAKRVEPVPLLIAAPSSDVRPIPDAGLVITNRSPARHTRANAARVMGSSARSVVVIVSCGSANGPLLSQL